MWGRGVEGRSRLEAGPVMKGVQRYDEGATEVCRKPLTRKENVEVTHRRTGGVLVDSGFKFLPLVSHTASGSVGLDLALISHG